MENHLTIQDRLLSCFSGDGYDVRPDEHIANKYLSTASRNVVSNREMQVIIGYNDYVVVMYTVCARL